MRGGTLLLAAVLFAPLACAGPSGDRGGGGAGPSPASPDLLAHRVDGFTGDLVELQRRVGIPGLSVALASLPPFE